MNSELPKVDITYGTKKKGDRLYSRALAFFASLGKTQSHSLKVTKIGGDVFISNAVKTNNRVGVLVFSDRRMLIGEVATMETIERRDLPIIDTKTPYFDKNSLPKPKTFNLILNKAHAVGKKVSVFLKSGETYSGVSKYHDFDSVQLETQSGDIVIMYDAVKRVVPLESDGSLSE